MGKQIEEEAYLKKLYDSKMKKKLQVCNAFKKGSKSKGKKSGSKWGKVNPKSFSKSRAKRSTVQSAKSFATYNSGKSSKSGKSGKSGSKLKKVPEGKSTDWI